MKTVRRKILLDLMGDMSVKDIRSLYFYIIFYCIRKKCDGWIRYEINYSDLLDRLSSYKINSMEYLHGDYFSVEPFWGNILKGINLKKLDKSLLKVTYIVSDQYLEFNIKYIGG